MQCSIGIFIGGVALRDTRIGDLDLSAGDTFALAAGAASREGDGGDQVNERVCRHLGFGAGEHRCRANHLVRAVLRVSLTVQMSSDATLEARFEWRVLMWPRVGLVSMDHNAVSGQ